MSCQEITKAKFPSYADRLGEATQSGTAHAFNISRLASIRSSSSFMPSCTRSLGIVRRIIQGWQRGPSRRVGTVSQATPGG